MKIGFSIQKIKDLIKNNISSLETRVTVLQNSGGGSGEIPSSVFYLSNGYLYKDANLTTKVTADEFATASASTILAILNMDMENFGTYMPLFIKSTVDENGHNAIKVFIMLENGTLKGVYTGPYEQQSGVE